MNKQNFKWLIGLAVAGAVFAAMPALASEDQTTSTEFLAPETTSTTTVSTTTEDTAETPTTTVDIPTTTEDTASSTPDTTTSTTDIATTTTDFSTSTPDTSTTTVDASTTPDTSTTTPSDPNAGSNSNTGSNDSPPPVLDIPLAADIIQAAADKILNFLSSQQTADGKILDGGTSDWAAMSFAAKNIYADTIAAVSSSLQTFISEYGFTDASDMNLCAGYPRHILSLLAAGTAKTDPALENLKQKIKTECLINNAYGQPGINDDVFGLIALLALDENLSDPTALAAFNGIVADQQADGSFTWSGWPGADITGAAIGALKYAESHGAAVDAGIFTRSKTYLKSQQLADGGWGYGSADALTTGWVVMGIDALGETQTDWFTAEHKNPWHALVNLLGETDHYLSPWSADGIDWFGTKHAVPALLSKKWPLILPPQTPVLPNQNQTASYSDPTPTPAPATTSTPETATTTTSTVVLSTSTPEITVVTSTTSTVPTTTPSSTETISPSPTAQNLSPAVPKFSAKPTIPTDNAPTPTSSVISSVPTENSTITNAVDRLPLDTPTRRNAKQLLAISGGGSAVFGFYLGLKLLRTLL